MAQGVKSEQKAAVRTLRALLPAPCYYPSAAICGYCLVVHRRGAEDAEGGIFCLSGDDDKQKDSLSERIKDRFSPGDFCPIVVSRLSKIDYVCVLSVSAVIA